MGVSACERVAPCARGSYDPLVSAQRQDAAAYLLILGSVEGLAWVLREKRMAFTRANASRAERLQPGNRLFLYTTRGIHGKPMRDRGLVIGEAKVASEVEEVRRPIKIGERDYTHACAIRLVSLAPYREGVELAPLIPHLEVFATKGAGWSALLRRPLLALPATDAELLTEKLAAVLRASRSPDQPHGGQTS